MISKQKRAQPGISAPLTGRLYTPGEAADYLSVAPQTLAHWRVRGAGPKFIHLSKRCVRYSELALRQFVEQRTLESTCENDGVG